MSATDDSNEFDVELSSIRKKWEKFDSFLAEIPFFKGLGDDSIKRISEQAEMKEYYKGQIIQNQNEISDLFYVILKGHATCYSQSNGLNSQIAILKCGDFFGGKGLFNNSSNIATIEAEDEVLCLVISRELFDKELRLIVNQLQQAEHLYGLFKNQF